MSLTAIGYAEIEEGGELDEAGVAAVLQKQAKQRRETLKELKEAGRLEQVAKDNEEVCAAPAPRVRFRTFGDSSLDFELLCWIAQPVDRGRLKHELNCAVYKAFADAGIEIPFPQRDLHVRTMPAG